MFRAVTVVPIGPPASSMATFPHQPNLVQLWDLYVELITQTEK